MVVTVVVSADHGCNPHAPVAGFEQHPMDGRVLLDMIVTVVKRRVAEDHDNLGGIGQQAAQPLQLSASYQTESRLTVIVTVGIGVFPSLAVEEIVGIEHNEAERTDVEGIIRGAHAEEVHIGLFVGTIHIVVAQYVIDRDGR